MPAKLRVPSLRHHKASNQAVVTLAGRDVYLGAYGSPEAQQRYEQAVAEWLAAGRVAPGPKAVPDRGPTIAQIVAPYLRHIDGYYRRKDGTATGEAETITNALDYLRSLYDHLPAREFGPLQLKAVRQRLLDARPKGKALCRTGVNRRVQMIVRAFRWAAEEGIIPASVWHELKCVQGLKAGRTDAPETDPVEPVADEAIEATLPHVTRQIAAMIRLQRLTGARPGEVCSLRACDLDMTGEVWIFQPSQHKGTHLGKSRAIPIGPKAQAIIREFLKPNTTAYLFSPRDAMAEWCERRKAENEANRAARGTKLYPHQRQRIDAKRKRQSPHRDHYDVDSYRQAVNRGIDKANRERKRLELPEVPHWHPHQIRHAAATEIRREAGLDAAQRVLGHSKASTTERYASADLGKAVEVIAKIG